VKCALEAGFLNEKFLQKLKKLYRFKDSKNIFAAKNGLAFITSNVMCYPETRCLKDGLLLVSSQALNTRVARLSWYVHDTQKLYQMNTKCNKWS
jgi:hypothetical protein